MLTKLIKRVLNFYDISNDDIETLIRKQKIYARLSWMFCIISLILAVVTMLIK